MTDGHDAAPDAASGFELLDHTADVGIRARGPDASALFEAAARGLFTVITDPGRVVPNEARRLRLQAESLAELLHAWLEQLNALHQIEERFFSRFDVRVEGTSLEATVHGEPIDPGRHDLRLEVKAVTWHGLEVRETPRGLEATVLLDI